jgi:predicted MPP superfamily phosphohydrolase
MRRRTLDPPSKDHLEHLPLETPAPARSTPRHFLDPRSGWFRTLERETSLFLSRRLFPRLPGRTVPYALQVLRHLTVSEGDIAVRGLPAGLDGLRVLVVTDIHAGPFLAVAALESALARFLTLRPDVILLGGDVATSNVAEVLPHLPALGGLQAPLGVFTVMGNHDHYTRDVPRLRAHFEEAGIRVLHNEAVLLERDGARIALAGIDDWLVGKPDLRGALRELHGSHDPWRGRAGEARGVVDDFQAIHIGEIETKRLGIAQSETKIMHSEEQKSAAVVETGKFVGERHGAQLMKHFPAHEYRVGSFKKDLAKFEEVRRAGVLGFGEGFDLRQESAEFVGLFVERVS